MTASSLSGGPRYTHLFACISEEDDSYVVQVRLYNQVKPEHAAWGEEITDSFERASMLIAGLAAEHSIAQDMIEIEIRLDTLTDGTRHQALRVVQTTSAGYIECFVLNFPNQNRFFDPTRRAVRFWGHDSAMEWSFFVSEEALRRLQPNMERDTASLLRAFDANLAAIHAAAIKAYKRERKGSYELLVTDF